MFDRIFFNVTENLQITFAQQEAYEWDRMVELGRRKKDTDVQSGEFNAGYVAEDMKYTPHEELTKAPANWTIGEAPGTRNSELPGVLINECQYIERTISLELVTSLRNAGRKDTNLLHETRTQC